MYSGEIEGFLNFLKKSEADYNIAVSSEKETDLQTQDLLHTIELRETGYHDMAKMAKLIKEVRQKRRDAKDTRIKCQYIIDWIEENGKVIKSLERLLGEVRKIERNLENRSYFPKTDIVEEYFNKRENERKNGL